MASGGVTRDANLIQVPNPCTLIHGHGSPARFIICENAPSTAPRTKIVYLGAGGEACTPAIACTTTRWLPQCCNWRGRALRPHLHPHSHRRGRRQSETRLFGGINVYLQERIPLSVICLGSSIGYLMLPGCSIGCRVWSSACRLKARPADRFYAARRTWPSGTRAGKDCRVAGDRNPPGCRASLERHFVRICPRDSPAVGCAGGLQPGRRRRVSRQASLPVS